MEKKDGEIGREQRAVQSVEVGGRLLLAFAASPGSMSLKEVAAAAELTPSRAHPYLVSFGKLRLIEQDAGTGRYALGPAALHLGLASLHQLDAVRVATPVAEELAAATGQAVALAIWGNLGPTIIRMIEAREPLHVSMRTGTVMSILGTATGRAFAAVMPRERLERAMAGGLEALGEPRKPRPREHLKELREIAAQAQRYGVARAVGRPIPGVNAFSTAALDHEGAPAIVVTAFGHQDHFSSDWNSDIAKAVRRAAAEISDRLGYRTTTVANAKQTADPRR